MEDIDEESIEYWKRHATRYKFICDEYIDLVSEYKMMVEDLTERLLKHEEKVNSSRKLKK